MSKVSKQIFKNRIPTLNFSFICYFKFNKPCLFRRDHQHQINLEHRFDLH